MTCLNVIIFDIGDIWILLSIHADAQINPKEKYEKLFNSRYYWNSYIICKRKI